MHKCAGADVDLCQPGCTGAASMQATLDGPHEDAQGGIVNLVIALQEVTHPLGHRQHPLPNRQMGKDVVRQVGRCLDHAPRVAGGADRAPLAGKGDQEIVAAVAATGARKAMRKDAALEVFVKRLHDMGWRRVMVALPVKLTRADQFQPRLEVSRDGSIQQRLLRVARAIQGRIFVRMLAWLSGCRAYGAELFYW
jgi:hypothetical protein